METEEFDLWMQEVMLDIGFSIHSKSETEIGYIDELKFFDPFLVGKHWTMVIFRNKTSTWDGYPTVDYRLYVHFNNGSFHSSPFQININDQWNRKYVRDKMESLFVNYFRDKKLDNLLNLFK